MRGLPIVASLLLTTSGAAFPLPRSTEASYIIIVNPRNPETTVDRRFLESAFLKKTTRWPNDEVIRPAELTERTAARREFDEEMLGRSVEAVKGYWQQRIFSGRDTPPPEFGTDQEVVDYVLKFDGAVGYVSRDASVDGAKILRVF